LTVVLDTSALLAVIFGEPGGNVVERSLSDAFMLTVNVSEAVSKLLDRGFDLENARRAVTRFPLMFVPFDQELAVLAASLRPRTRHLGFSFADRACLALAGREGRAALTADRVWSQVDLGITVELIR
jgi:PIN domain nuclease of toxin-antitoxin system